MTMKDFFRYATRLSAVALCSAGLVMSLGTTPMLAQGGGGGRMQMTPEQQTANLDKAVTLTPDQKPKVMAIFEASSKKMADLRASGGDPADMRPKMMAIRTDQQAAINALLTDDQKAKYAAMPQPGRGGPGGGGGAPPPPQ